jgi:transposase
MTTGFLTSSERIKLRSMQKKGTEKARVVNRARILLKLDLGEKDTSIASEVFVCVKTVQRIYSRYDAGGLERALFDLPRSGQPPIITDKVEAHLVAIACSNPPEGRIRWTLELLQQKLIEDKKVKRISSVAILKHLQKRGIKPWVEKNVVHSEDHGRIHRTHGNASHSLRTRAKSR